MKKHERGAYWNYKSFHSVHLQAVGDANRLFTDCFVGFPGRAHSAAVFKESPLFDMLPEALCIPGRALQDTYHIVTDSAYPCLENTMSAFKLVGRNNNDDVKKFNTHLASKHQVIERAFALLMSRWPRLSKLRCRTMRKNIDTILAACVLHNFCVIYDNDDDDIFDMQPYIGAGNVAHANNAVGHGLNAIRSAKRQLLINIVRTH